MPFFRSQRKMKLSQAKSRPFILLTKLTSLNSLNATQLKANFCHIASTSLSTFNICKNSTTATLKIQTHLSRFWHNDLQLHNTHQAVLLKISHSNPNMFNKILHMHQHHHLNLNFNLTVKNLMKISDWTHP